MLEWYIPEQIFYDMTMNNIFLYLTDPEMSYEMRFIWMASNVTPEMLLDLILQPH